MAIALRAMRASGELTAAQALGRLRREAPAAVHTAAGAVALTAVAIVVAFAAGEEIGAYELLALLGLGLAIATCAALGALVLAARPGHRLGLALLVGGALGSLWTLATVTVEAADTGERLGQWAAWLDNWTFVGLLVLVTWPLLLFPDGRLPSRRWRPVAWLLALALAGLALRGMLDPGTLDEIDGDVPNPLGVPADWSWVNALGVFGFGIPLGVVAGMVAVQVRARRRPEPAMRAALWASRGLAANFVLCLALNLTDSPLADGAFYAATLTTSIGAFAATAAVAILRDRAVEVDLLLRRAFIVAGVAVGTPARLPRRVRPRHEPDRLVGERARGRPGRRARRGAPAGARPRPRRPRAVRAPRPVDRRAAPRGAARARRRARGRAARRRARAARDARRIGRADRARSRRRAGSGRRRGGARTSRGSSARSATAGCNSGG